MPSIDFSHLSRQERIDLIGELCESLDGASPPLTAAQRVELDRRAASIEADVATARGADEILAELRRTS